ncbi:hypothetical protein DFH07DRAFT_966847 [Mycena maculata]|uniref:Uncharacterized protein n=1 Tax=Mycena maculata TaxID=230809 RepID=A0AAD7I782_9AGAR|nr:hypothetical protein DFH07DRAFT_966847 [Mycena maculata]
MVTNHFALTEALLPLLKATANESGADVRIVTVASSTHARVQPTTFSTKEAFNKDYGESVYGRLNTYGKGPPSSIEKYRVTYLVPMGAVTVPSSFAQDERLQRELYETTEKILAELA